VGGRSGDEVEGMQIILAALPVLSRLIPSNPLFVLIGPDTDLPSSSRSRKPPPTTAAAIAALRLHNGLPQSLAYSSA
jgi:hypothetical protein